MRLALPAKPAELSAPPRRITVEPIRLVGRPPTRGVPRLVAIARTAIRGSLPNGWPLKYLLVGFPLWWVLGLSSFIFPIAAIPMARDLGRRYRREGRIALPPAFALWALFLAWQVVDLLVFGLTPPGTATGTLSGRIVTIVLTSLEYAGVTITLLYVGNLPRDPKRGGVPSTVIGRWLGWFFLTVLAGGFLGLVAPTLQFKSFVEFVLPRPITSNGFVRSLVHPVAAQAQDLISNQGGRPSAPFGYTNTWGNALSLLLIWFVATWVMRASGGRRWIYAVVAALSMIPVIFSLNRGLWIGLVVTGLWLLVRQLLRGRIGLVLSAFAGVGVAGLAMAQTPLLGVIASRLQHGQSNDIRSFVGNLSIVAIKHSPIVGYGGTRHALGSASSIAVGPTSSCPTCGSVPTGSTGDLWAILFNQGIGGALLYFGFFAAVIVVYWRSRGVVSEAALITIALVFVYMLFYSTLPVAQTLTMIAVGILWREGRPGHDPPDTKSAAAPRTAPARER